MAKITQLREHAPQQSLWHDVAANVRAEAARQRYNQLTLAKALDMSRTAVGERWRGTTQWQLVELERLGRLFRVDPAEFLRTWRDSNSQPSDLESAQVIDLGAYRVAVAS